MEWTVIVIISVIILITNTEIITATMLLHDVAIIATNARMWIQSSGSPIPDSSRT